MAWIDDRAWCHPKLSDLSDRAWRTYFSGIAYSSGMGTKGVLTVAQQQLVRSTARVRRELVEAGLWDDLGDAVSIHDWDDHNGKRDERRAKDRERKRVERAAGRPQDSPQDAPPDRRALKEVKVVKEVKSSKQQSVSQDVSRAVDKLLGALPDKDASTHRTVVRLCQRYRLAEGDVMWALECATGPGVESPTRVAVAELRKRGEAKAA